MHKRRPIRLLLHGATGRMGTLISALARNDARFEMAAPLGSADDPARVLEGIGEVDVVVDFSCDAGALRATAIATELRCALLVGTTALSGKTLDAIGVLARSVPVMVAPNTSLGIAVMNRLAREAAQILGRRFDIHLIEHHHVQKKDAPSGTALRLAETIRQTGANLPPENILAIRAGDITGRHEIRFCGPGEEFSIFHNSTSRNVFAQGALEAAAWLAEQPAGMYGMEDALGLE